MGATFTSDDLLALLRAEYPQRPQAQAGDITAEQYAAAEHIGVALAWYRLERAEERGLLVRVRGVVVPGSRRPRTVWRKA